MTDVRIECEAPYVPVWVGHTMEARAKHLDQWAREFNSFIRDHRSQDDVTVNVTRVFGDICSHCKRDWETDDDGLPVCCDKAQAEFEALQVTKP
jgi:hypothetical protein